jgi:hypothetical protein
VEKTPIITPFTPLLPNGWAQNNISYNQVKRFKVGRNSILSAVTSTTLKSEKSCIENKLYT